METREERLAREQKHFKKKTKATTKYKKGLAPVKEKNWKNRLLEGNEPLAEPIGDDD